MLQPLQVLQKYWGYNAFRPNQDKIINNILSGNDTLALLPTGGGKSICFQVPALVLEGICLVVSPLIALMKDQVENLQKLGIKAHAIYSGLHYREIQIIINNCINGDVKFLYMSPERLVGSAIREQLSMMNVNLIAVDEAHCISQWGYDFRPEYRHIATVREIIPKANVLALTASATAKVVDDIQVQLAFKKKVVFKNSFERKNLHYIVRYTEQKLDKIVEAVNKINGSGLIYVRSRKKTEELANYLNQVGIKAGFYHAGLEFETRQKKQDDWIQNRIRIMVCTNAFGMGIDKPDCRLVIHYEMPDSLEAYYQEAGRAGRDGKKAFCLLLYNKADELNLEQRVLANFPPENEIRQVYQALCNYFMVPIGSNNERSFDFDIDLFCEKYKLKKQTVFASVKILEQLELLKVNDSFFEPSKIKIVSSNNDLYRFQVENEKLDVVIKILLRSYGGLFENYVPINESFLARKLKTDEETFKKALKKLTELKIIDYLPNTGKPQLIFTSERVESEYISFQKSLLRVRKQMYLEKLKAMQHFSSQLLQCRSRVLLAYFDELNTIDCGQCDICVEKRKNLPQNKDFQNLSNQLKSICVEPKNLDEIVKLTKGFKVEEITFMLRILIDNGEITFNKSNQFIWKKN
ncbi:MAG: ATP-dependent DNA helicase RecQ [Bacteroidia bacterium]